MKDLSLKFVFSLSLDLARSIDDLSSFWMYQVLFWQFLSLYLAKWNVNSSTEMAFSLVYFYFRGNRTICIMVIPSLYSSSFCLIFIHLRSRSAENKYQIFVQAYNILKRFNKFSFKIFSFRKILSLAGSVSIKNNTLFFRVIAFNVLKWPYLWLRNWNIKRNLTTVSELDL